MDNVVEKFKKLEIDKSPMLPVWEDINRFAYPSSQSFMSEYSAGANKRKLQFDSVAERALEIFASSMIGMIANPTTKYINYEPRNKDLHNDRSVQEFIEEAQDYVLSVFNNPATKFYDNLFYTLQNLGAYGTASLLSDSDEKHVATFRAESPRNFNFTEGFNGTVEEIYLERKYTYAQLERLADENGWELPQDFNKKKPDEECKVVRWIGRNPEFSADGVGEQFMRYRSEYWLKDEQKKVKTSGFNTFPAPIGRWGQLDDLKWGDSPARMALNEIKILNASERHLTFAEEYSLRPALFVSSEAKFGKLNLSPGAVNAGRGNPNDTLRTLGINGDLNFSLERNRLRRETIMQAFYVDVFQTMSDNDMTATEVQIRAQEKLRGIAPKAARIQTDILGPTAERILRMGIDRGDLVVPEALKGQSLEVVYTSPLAIAQRSQEAINLQMFLQDAFMVAQANPEALMRLDFDAITEEFAEIRGVPAKVLLEEKEYEALKQAMQQQQQLQQGLATAQQAGEAGQALQAVGNESS